MTIGTKLTDLCGKRCTLVAVQPERDSAWIQYDNDGTVMKTTINDVRDNFTRVADSDFDRVVECAKVLAARLRCRITDDSTAWPGDRSALLELDQIEGEIYRRRFCE